MTRWLLALITIAVMLGAIAYALRPVCVAIPIEAVEGFDPPIAARTDRDFYLTVFQLRDGKWHQCKTWISRQFFF